MKNVFLEGDLTNEVYMYYPHGYEGQLSPNIAWRLKKSLYGLKQSPHAWFERFTAVI